MGAHSEELHPARGVLLVVISLAVFACMDTVTKVLAQTWNVPLIIAVRYIVHAVAMAAILGPMQGAALVRTRRPGLVALRGLCMAIASLLVALAMQRLPVAEAIAIVFLSPLVVVLLSGTLLRERVGAADWLAALGGFAGILLIARPGGGLDPVGVAYALAAVLFNAGYQLLSRQLRAEPTLTLLFHSAVIGAVLLALALPWTLHGPEPTALQALSFALIGLAGGYGHYLFTAAHRFAPASTLAPLMYGQILFSVLTGWIAFGHLPDRIAVAGMIVVSAAGAFVALRARRLHRAAAPVTPEP